MLITEVLNFDLIENSPYYNYDKFDKDWYLWSDYEEDTFWIAIRFGLWNIDNNYSPELRAWVANSNKVAYSFSEIQILLDETVYSFENLSPINDNTKTCYVFGGRTLRHFLKVLPIAKEIAIRCKDKDGSVVKQIDNIDINEMKDIIEMGKLLEDSGIWNLYEDQLDMIDKNSGTYINGEVPSNEEIEAMLIEINTTPIPTPTPEPTPTPTSSPEPTLAPTYDEFSMSALQKTIEGIIPDASIWGISTEKLKEAYKADFHECQVGEDLALRVSDVEVCSYVMDVYYVFEEASNIGLSKIVYVLRDSDNYTGNELDQCLSALVEETKTVKGEPNKVKKNTSIWEDDKYRIEIGKGKLSKYTGSDNTTVAIIFKKKDLTTKSKTTEATSNSKDNNEELMAEPIDWKKILRNPKKYANNSLKHVFVFDHEEDTIMDGNERKKVLMCCDFYEINGEVDLQWVYIIVNKNDIVVDGRLLANDKIEVHGTLLGELKKFIISSNGYEGEAPIIEAEKVTLIGDPESIPEEVGDSNVEESSDTSGFSDLTEFKSVMMESVSSQVNSAVDFTTSSEKRAVLAALLSLEFANQEHDFSFDYTLPIYVGKQGNIASVAIGGERNYAVIMYQSKPLYTAYRILYGNNPETVKASMMVSSEEIWQVKLDDYNEKLATLIDQIK